MTPNLATILCITLIIYLFWIDRKNRKGVSNAVYIPLIWMLLAGSRYVSQWLNLSGPTSLIEASTDGSPTDAIVFFLLITAGTFILYKRKKACLELLKRNKLICFYLLYCGVSIIWSDYPFTSLKRWIKELGNPIMVMVLLTEVKPYKALSTVLRYFAFMLLPLSFLFVKYYPEFGRAYHMGIPMVTGVAQHKNGLGAICMISGLYFSWELLLNKHDRASDWRLPYSIYMIMLPLIIWLLYMANSATSLACLIVSIAILMAGKLSVINKKPSRILYLAITSVILLGILQSLFNVKDILISVLGRRPDLTNRVPLWNNLLSMAENPIIGTGFMSFWSGERLNLIFEKIGSEGVQAHNGYLEQYLNLGYIGVMFIIGMIISGLRKVSKCLNQDYPSAMLLLCIIVTSILSNFTEASFYGINTLWILLLFALFGISNSNNCTEPFQDAAIKGRNL